MTKFKEISLSEREALLDNLVDYFSILRNSFDMYQDLNTERYKLRSTGKIESKKKVYSTGVKLSRLIDQIYTKALCPNLLKTVIEDYRPDLEMGKCEYSVEWFLDIAMGEVTYQRRSASDQDVISKRNEIVDAMLIYHQIRQDVWFKRITQYYPENWYHNSQFLNANTKAPAEKKEKGIREPIKTGLDLLLAADKDEKLTPSRLAIWLAMNPRDLFTTEEGRAERDRQAARLEQGETTL